MVYKKFFIALILFLPPVLMAETLLSKDQGYWLLDLNLDQTVNKIVIRRGIRKTTLGPFEPGQYARLIKLSAGEYRITRIELGDYGDISYISEEYAGENLRAMVKPEAVNYLGRLTVINEPAFDIHVRNRLATDYKRFQTTYSDVLKTYPLVEANVQGSHFADVYLKGAE